MANVIGVRFENAGKLYFFDVDGNWPTPGDFVVVETSRGMELGEVVMPVHELEDDKITEPLKKVVRVASAEDVQHKKDNKAAEKEAFDVCQKKIADHKLDMKLVQAEYTFDNSKLLFYFTANGRVDFRSLVKDLAGVFHTRIELRQIGVRDEAKMLGGLGPCGRPICCGTFLGDFQPVSIKMAKEQNLSLNPTKISGVCGRLMCCLKYEEDTYEMIRKSMPKVGREVMTPDGPGTVWDLNIIKETVRVRIQKGDSGELKDYSLEQLNLPNNSKENVQTAVPSETPREASAEQDQDEQKKEKPAHKEKVKQKSETKREEEIQEDESEQKPAAQTEQEVEKPVEAPENTKPAASNWKEALERAMQAANAENK